ncbi:alkaline phosphatase, partial [Neisseria weixii]
RDHTTESAPREACGLVVLVGRAQIFVPCENISESPADSFEISPDDWIRAEQQGEIVAVVHSHPYGEPYLSGADRQIHARPGLPWVLAVNDELKVFRSCPHLRGRVFDYGRADCGTLVRDALMLAGLDLPDHRRTDMDADAAADYWQQHLTACGFAKVPAGLSDVSAGDVILTAYGGHANHAALYLGGGMMLHHAYNRLSCREPYSRYWQEFTHSVWRHKDWRPEMLQAIENDLIHTE